MGKDIPGASTHHRCVILFFCISKNLVEKSFGTALVALYSCRRVFRQIAPKSAFATPCLKCDLRPKRDCIESGGNAPEKRIDLHDAVSDSYPIHR